LKEGSALGIRTDLAVEAHEIWMESTNEISERSGVSAKEYEREGFKITRVEILDENGAREIGKPVGTYITVELTNLIKRENDAFKKAVLAISEELRDMIEDNGAKGMNVLIAGLGNRNITPDAIGPAVIDNVMVTRHLHYKMPDEFKSFANVAAISPGVLGMTGVESGDIIRALSGKIKPGLVIAIDALASRKLSRLCTTVQISDTGIIPGAGVGNARSRIDRSTIGAPVIALGVPTVVDAATLAEDLLSDSGITIGDSQKTLREKGDMIVTPKDIDKYIHDTAKLMGYAINIALNPGLEITDVDMFLS